MSTAQLAAKQQRVIDRWSRAAMIRDSWYSESGWRALAVVITELELAARELSRGDRDGARWWLRYVPPELSWARACFARNLALYDPDAWRHAVA